MPNNCPHCSKTFPTSSPRIIKAGSFRRTSDHKIIQRFQCKTCLKFFSQASFSPCFYQKKRQYNPAVFHFLASGGTLRRAAKIFKLDRKTVTRKLIFLGLMADRVLEEQRKSLRISEFQFDDLETFEHSKLKPLSVTIAVESETRKVLGFRVAQMPAKGLLVKKSFKKYGRIKDERGLARRDLLKELQSITMESCHIKSDENPHYTNDVKKFFPKATHSAYKGRRGCVVGQGELKAGGYDSLFSLNHTYAMFRANVSRLFRRTWNTTKKRQRLALHLSLYSLYHNNFLLSPDGGLEKLIRV